MRRPDLFQRGGTVCIERNAARELASVLSRWHARVRPARVVPCLHRSTVCMGLHPIVEQVVFQEPFAPEHLLPATVSLVDGVCVPTSPVVKALQCYCTWKVSALVMWHSDGGCAVMFNNCYDGDGMAEIHCVCWILFCVRRCGTDGGIREWRGARVLFSSHTDTVLRLRIE